MRKTQAALEDPRIVTQVVGPHITACTHPRMYFDLFSHDVLATPPSIRQCSNQGRFPNLCMSNYHHFGHVTFHKAFGHILQIRQPSSHSLEVKRRVLQGIATNIQEYEVSALVQPDW